MTVYTSKNGYPLKDKDAKVIGKFLAATFPEGTYTPKDVLEAARPRSSPIHQYFDWDDSSAAEKFRLNQARQLIRCVVEIINDVPAPQAVNVRVANVNEGNLVYMNTKKALETPDIMEQILDKAVRDAVSWAERYERYRELSELQPIVREVRELEKSHLKRKSAKEAAKAAKATVKTRVRKK